MGSTANAVDPSSRSAKEMKLYILKRWGNPHESDGPDGADTHFLARARSLEEAAKMVDIELQEMPTIEGKNREVTNFVGYAVEVGTEKELNESRILCGPWVSRWCLLPIEDLEGWHRDEPNGEWHQLTHL